MCFYGSQARRELNVRHAISIKKIAVITLEDVNNVPSEKFS